jgi:hypothetical protein
MTLNNITVHPVLLWLSDEEDELFGACRTCKTDGKCKQKFNWKTAWRGTFVNPKKSRLVLLKLRRNHVGSMTLMVVVDTGCPSRL